jgi:hypothetical protein
MLRIIETLNPDYVIGENVSGILSSKMTKTFGDIILSLMNLGYNVAWGSHAAESTYLTHIRERVFIVARKPGALPLCNEERASKYCHRYTNSDFIVSPPGFKQFDWEPPRVLSVGGDSSSSHAVRRNRLKSLGNAVCPRQVVPVLLAMTAERIGHHTNPVLKAWQQLSDFLNESDIADGKIYSRCIASSCNNQWVSAPLKWSKWGVALKDRVYDASSVYSRPIKKRNTDLSQDAQHPINSSRFGVFSDIDLNFDYGTCRDFMPLCVSSMYGEFDLPKGSFSNDDDVYPYQQPQSGPTWPTMAAMIPQDYEAPDTWLKRREHLRLTKKNGNGAGMPLSIAVQLGMPKSLSRMVLNPDWAEALMGFPPGWTRGI